tara:strand:- start:1243 stop:1461 length:219 start_codon:yes stop_codon:yes gene_type:complete
MNNYINPYILIKAEYLEATTILRKSLVLFLAAWGIMLFSIFLVGISVIGFELITNPSTFSNATWGIFDTLGS